MDIIAVIIRNVAALVLLAALLELLLPEGATARFIRVVIGLTLIAAVVLPLANSLELEWQPPRFAAPDSAAAAQFTGEGAAIASALQSEAELQYAAELNRQISALAALSEGVSAATATVSIDETGALQHIALRLTLTPDADPAQASANAISLVSGFYLVEEAQIDCESITAEEEGG